LLAYRTVDRGPCDHVPAPGTELGVRRSGHRAGRPRRSRSDHHMRGNGVVHRISAAHAGRRDGGRPRSRWERRGPRGRRRVRLREGVPALGAEQSPFRRGLPAMLAYGHTEGKVNSVYLRLVRW
jgi:hypothetical protein